MYLRFVDVLLVEDNLANAGIVIREFERHHLENSLVHLKDREDFNAFLMASRRPVSVQATLGRPKIVLLESEMTTMNCMDVLRRIRRNKATKDAGVVVLTSSNEDPAIHKWYHLGANSYIVKPLYFEKFVEAILDFGFHWQLINK